MNLNFIIKIERLIHHRGRNFPPGSPLSDQIKGVRKVVFKEYAGRGVYMELKSLYPAFGYAVLYKMLQRYYNPYPSCLYYLLIILSGHFNLDYILLFRGIYKIITGRLSMIHLVRNGPKQ